MRLIDLHCDTASAIFKHRTLLEDNDHHISLNKLAAYDNFAQVMAIFIPHNLSDADGYLRFCEIHEYFASRISSNADKVEWITHGDDIQHAWDNGHGAMVLSLEDARILQNDITKLDIIYKKGVRSIVFMWSGETCIGGSHNTESGLTDFGCSVMHRCLELGIVPDVSHASAQTTSDMLEIACEAGKPVIASHSNSYAVYPHTRNLRDEHFGLIRDLGGIVGLSLCPYHLSGEHAGVDDIIRHADHYLSLGGENVLCLGCDLDGTDLPDGFSDVRDLEKIQDAMVHEGYNDRLINKIFWANAKRFMENNIK